MEILTIIFGIIGGLALFLYGLYLLSESLQKIAGEKLKLIIERLTNNKLKGVTTGALVTATIQSSSITTVTLIGLINAGLINLEQAISVIIGANIGTTITAQLIVFKIGKYALPIIAIGVSSFLLSKNKKLKNVGKVLLGFGLLFLGMNLMSSGVRPLQDLPFFINLISDLGKIPLLGIAIGAIFTGIIQSSSATSGLVIAMGMENLLSLKSAIAIIIGANIGTCITVLLASFGASLSGKRAAIAHLIFNVTGAVIFIPFLSVFSNLVSLTSRELPRQIANAHSLFNITTTIILLPFMFFLIFLVKKIIPGKEFKVDGNTKFLDNRLLNTPSIAISQTFKETNRMAGLTYEMLKDCIKIFKDKDKELIRLVLKKEDAVDNMFRSISGYLVKISQRELSKEDSRRLSILSHSIRDIERVGDHVNNLVESAERKFKEKLIFSEEAEKELEIMFEKVRVVYEKTITALKEDNKELAKEVIILEDDIDKFEDKFEKSHINRLKEKTCNPASGIIFVDILRNLERISDHATNIVNTIRFGF